MRAIWQNRSSLKEKEQRLKKEIVDKYGDDKVEITKTDILAMIIAAFEVLLPVVLVIVGVFTLFTLLFTNGIFK